MNEQDFKQWLQKKTDNTPIPDRLSPESIAEQLKQPQHKKSWYKSPWMNLAAAFLLLGIISTTIFAVRSTRHLNSSSKDSNAIMSEGLANEADLNMKDEDGASATRNTPVSSKSNIRTAGSYHQLYRLLNRLTVSFDDMVIETVDESPADTNSFNKSDTTGSLANTQNSAALQGEDDSSYYDTNSQVKEVAEADIVKTDGVYIYSCYRQSGYNANAVAIAKAENGNLETCSILSTESLTAEIHCDNFLIRELYVVNERLVLLCEGTNPNQNNSYSTYILTYDVRNAEQPIFLSVLVQEGSYNSSRLTNNCLYTFSTKWESLPSQYKDYDEYIPHTDNERLNCHDIYIPECPDSSCYQIMTGMQLEAPEHFTCSKAILSGYGTYYVSGEHIYFAQRSWENGATTTELLKFQYKDGNILPMGSVTIDGYLLNQFSMDEYNGYLRVAATVTPTYSISTGYIEEDISTSNALMESAADPVVHPSAVMTNALYIIDSDMNLAGKIDNLAPGERIYSVRFMGDTGYFVTFRETDPLFSVDLSDPENPTVMDALKIPGFSNYLHFYSEDLLFGLGEEINPITGEFMGLKLSMFDVSNPYNIIEVEKTVLSDIYYSPACYDHKALMIDPERNLIGFYAEYYNENTYDYKEEYVIYSYVKGEGFRKRFTCDIMEEPTLSDIDYTGEYRYWMDFSEIRGLYIGDYLYLVYGNRICSYALDTYDKKDELIVQIQ